MVAGSYDFLGMNFYTTNMVYTEIQNISEISYYSDSDVHAYQVIPYAVTHEEWTWYSTAHIFNYCFFSLMVLNPNAQMFFTHS